DAEVIDENNYRRGGPKDEDGHPDHAALQASRPARVVGLYGGLTSTVPRLFEVARYYQSLGVTTVAGGQHFVGENISEALHNGIDIVVLGEGEDTIRELLEHAEGERAKADIRGIAYLEDGAVVRTPEREPLGDFDRLPFPDFSLVRYANIRVYPVGRVRGCGMNCEFCAVKGRPRYARVERLVDQFAELHEKYEARMFFVVDDLFGQKREEAIHLCRLLEDYQKRAGARFRITVQIRLDKARDPELLSAMRAAGINMLAVGIESPIREELEAMNKRLDPDEMMHLVRAYRRQGFRVHGMFIFGYPMPEEVDFRMPARERVRRFRRFIRKSRIDTIQVLLPVPLPGTELTRRLEEQGRIYPRAHVGWEYYDGNFPLFEPDDPLTAEQMQASIRRILGRFYRARRMVSLALHTVSLPAIVFHLHHLKRAWRRWDRRWWRSVYRLTGWRILRKWTADLKKSDFWHRIARAKQALKRMSARKTLSSK
ncbi:MAG: radical SAM protein, partial [Planctomycetota bacterium]